MRRGLVGDTRPRIPAIACKVRQAIEKPINEIGDDVESPLELMVMGKAREEGAGWVRVVN